MQTPQERAYVLGVSHADRLLARGMCVVAIVGTEDGTAFDLSFLKHDVITRHRWVVGTPHEWVLADALRDLEGANV